MLNSGEKKFALSATKKNILTLVLSEKIFRNETKNQVKWSVPYNTIFLYSQLKAHFRVE